MQRAVFRRGVGAALTALVVLGAAGGCDRGNGAVPAPPSANGFANTPAPGAPLPAQPPTNDPQVVLQRMVAAYRTLDSLHLEAEADIVTHIGPPSQYHQSTVLKYRRQPARLAMNIEDPAGGTRQFFADGATLVQFHGLTNQYLRRDLRGDLKAISQHIDKSTPQILSPLVFLQSDAMPLGVASVRMTGTETVGGKPAYVLKGTFDPAYQRDLSKRLFGAEFPPAKGEFTLWLDQNTSLLLKSSMALAWRGVVRLKQQDRQVEFTDPALEVTERATQLVQNPTLSENEFRFNAPKNAQQIFIERRGVGY